MSGRGKGKLRLREIASVASSGRRFPPSVSAAFAEWVAAAGGGDLSLGFNAGAAPASAVWGPTRQSSASTLNYGIATAAGDVLVAAPAAASSSFHHQSQRAVAAADPGFALLSAGRCTLVDPDADNKSGTAIQFWQPTADTKPAASVMASVGGSGGGASCNDCGNQAKKDCPYQRCRTCCKSQGFDCTTHVRSTWIPAASRRRDRQNPAGPNGDDSASGLSPSSSSKKARRLLSCQQTTTTNSRTQSTSSRSFDATSTQQEGPYRESLPRYVRAPAVFRCVRVTSVDDGGGDDELAYQASVTINGHMFRGFLYDQGRGNVSVDGSSSHAAAAVRSISDLHLGTAVSSSAVPPGVYDAVGGALILGGLSYGNTIN